jgi:hypothetical protein
MAHLAAQSQRQQQCHDTAALARADGEKAT